MEANLFPFLPPCHCMFALGGKDDNSNFKKKTFLMSRKREARHPALPLATVFREGFSFQSSLHFRKVYDGMLLKFDFKVINCIIQKCSILVGR